MGLVLKHVEQTKSGSFQYRRRVPKAVNSIITKREFKQKLGDSRREALAAYPRYHAHVEREIESATRRLAAAQAASRPDASDREAYAEALRRRAALIEAGATEEELALSADVMADSYPQDGWEPVGVPPVERHTINLMRLGPDRYRAPEPTLQDARRLYVDERLGGAARAGSQVIGRVNRVILLAVRALGRDPVLTTLTREDARKVRDEMLDRVKSNGKKVSPASVQRELTGIKAIINFAKMEFDLPASFVNPFNSLPLGVEVTESDGDKRSPLPHKVLKEVRGRVLSGANPELALIWRLLEGTGCRLAEVAGLRTEDVDTASQFPHIRVTWHENRRLKTRASFRSIPLVGDALEAAKESVKLPREGHLLFPRYAAPRGADAASAALMKHIRRVSPDPKHVVHSLRHNMKDALILAEVSSLDQNLILGHALGGVGDRVYGGSVAKLRATTRAMKRTLGVSLSDAEKQGASEDE